MTQNINNEVITHLGYDGSVGVDCWLRSNKLNKTSFPSAVNDWGTMYPIPDMIPPLLAEEEGPPT
jgi:hypothetical protein